MNMIRYRKCPECKKYAPHLQRRCECGHTFTGGEAGYKVCPACGSLLRDGKLRCSCGYLFIFRRFLDRQCVQEYTKEDINAAYLKGRLAGQRGGASREEADASAGAAYQAGVQDEKAKNDREWERFFALANLKNTVSGGPIRTRSDFYRWVDEFERAKAELARKRAQTEEPRSEVERAARMQPAAARRESEPPAFPERGTMHEKAGPPPANKLNQPSQQVDAPEEIFVPRFQRQAEESRAEAERVDRIFAEEARKISEEKARKRRRLAKRINAAALIATCGILLAIIIAIASPEIIGNPIASAPVTTVAPTPEVAGTPAPSPARTTPRSGVPEITQRPTPAASPTRTTPHSGASETSTSKTNAEAALEALWEKYAPTPNPTPTVRVIYPATGTVYVEPDEDGISPLAIKSSVGVGYYIVLSKVVRVDEYYSSGSRAYMSFYVQGGSDTEVLVPAGEYEIFYACGNHFYGPQDLFGSETRYYKCDDTFTFDYYTGWTLTLYRVPGGNLETESIRSYQFPR